MTRLQFARRFAQKGYTYLESKKIVEDFIKTIVEVMAEGESIVFQNFGKFEVYDRAINKSDRPKWVSQELAIGETYKSLKFVPHKTLRAIVCTGMPFTFDVRSGTSTSKYKFGGKAGSGRGEE